MYSKAESANCIVKRKTVSKILMHQPLIVITITRVLQPSFSLDYILASSCLFLPYYTLAKKLARVYSSYRYNLATTYTLDFQNFVFFLGENTVIIKILYNLSKSLPILGVGQHGGPDHGLRRHDD